MEQFDLNWFFISTGTSLYTAHHTARLSGEDQWGQTAGALKPQIEPVRPTMCTKSTRQAHKAQCEGVGSNPLYGERTARNKPILTFYPRERGESVRQQHSQNHHILHVFWVTSKKQ